MKVIFFDTDFVSNWHKGDKRFEFAIRIALQEIDQMGAHVSLMAAVNWHEFLSWATRVGKRTEAEKFLKTNFPPGPVMFDERAVSKSLEVQTIVLPPQKKLADGAKLTGAEYTKEKDIWFRDVAMIGTALAQGAHALVTCSKDIQPKYSKAVGAMKIIHVQEVTVTTPAEA